MTKKNETNLTDTAVVTETATQNKKQSEQKTTKSGLQFDKLAADTLFEMATTYSETLGVIENFCERMQLDMADCATLSDMLENDMLLDLSYNEPMGERALGRITATARAVNDLLAKVKSGLSKLTSALCTKKCKTIKETLIYDEN